MIAELEGTIDADRKLATALEHCGVSELDARFAAGTRNAAALAAVAQKLGLKVCGRPEENE